MENHEISPGFLVTPGKRTPSHSAGDKDANAKGRHASAEKGI